MENNGVRIEIVYCPNCRWLMRSAWYAQELLETFSGQIGEVALAPDYNCGGRFEIRVADTLVWERTRDGGFPGVKELKQRVRDILQPGRDLGHLDRNKPEDNSK